MTNVNLTDAECSLIRYALNELANRQQEQSINFCENAEFSTALQCEAASIRALAKRFQAAQNLKEQAT